MIELWIEFLPFFSNILVYSEEPSVQKTGTDKQPHPHLLGNTSHHFRLLGKNVTHFTPKAFLGHDNPCKFQP